MSGFNLADYVDVAERIRLYDGDGHFTAEVIIDLDDLERLGSRPWRLAKNGYVVRGGGNEKEYLHRFLLGLMRGDGLVVDHVNGDRLDNRKSNLRVVSHAENSQNRHARSGRSHYRGVYWHRGACKWMAKATRNYKQVYLGLFEREEDAAKAVTDFWGQK